MISIDLESLIGHQLCPGCDPVEPHKKKLRTVANCYSTCETLNLIKNRVFLSLVQASHQRPTLCWFAPYDVPVGVWVHSLNIYCIYNKPFVWVLLMYLSVRIDQVERLALEILPKAADPHPVPTSSPVKETAADVVQSATPAPAPAPAHGGSLEPAGELAAMKARLEALEAAREKQDEELKALKAENERRQAEYEAWKTDKDKLKRWVSGTSNKAMSKAKESIAHQTRTNLVRFVFSKFSLPIKPQRYYVRPTCESIVPWLV